MCFGDVKTADQYYQEMKVKPEPLPSLAVANAVERKVPVYGDVNARIGSARRSLLNPMNGSGSALGY